MLREAGLDERDVEIIDPGFNLVAPLIANEFVTSTGSQLGEYLTASKEHGELIRFFPYTEQCPAYPTVIIGNRQWLEENASIARAFNEATLRGAVYAIENPQEAYDIFVERFPDQQDELTQAKMTEAQLFYCDARTSETGIGHSDLHTWQELVDLLVDEGSVEHRYDASELVTNDFMPEKRYVTSRCSDTTIDIDPTQMN